MSEFPVSSGALHNAFILSISGCSASPHQNCRLLFKLNLLNLAVVAAALFVNGPAAVTVVNCVEKRSMLFYFGYKFPENVSVDIVNSEIGIDEPFGDIEV